MLVDTDGLMPGQDWNAQLYRWLDECQAAVILLSAKALASTWVRREVNILLWRRARNPALVVVPALLGIDAQDANQAGYEELAPVQALRCPYDDGAGEDQLVAGIVGCFPPSLPEPEDDPLCKWLRRIARTLHTVPAPYRDALPQAARWLGVPDDHPVEWSHEEGCRLLAAQLLGRGLLGRPLERAMWELAQSLDRDSLSRLITDALPTWVDPEAARRVLPARRGEDPDRMVVLLDVASEELAADYLARAMCREIPDYEFTWVVMPPVGEAAVDEVLDSCRLAVRYMLCLADHEPLEPSAPHDRDKVYYLLLHPGAAPPYAVARAVRVLHQECPWLVVVVLAAGGRMTMPILSGAGITDIVLVKPPLEPGDETRARQTRTAVRSMPSRAYESQWR